MTKIQEQGFGDTVSEQPQKTTAFTKTVCVVRWLGELRYQDAWDLQREIAQAVAVGSEPPTLFLLEHPHTYTLGRSTQDENLLWDRETLTQRGVELFNVDRGGDVTYHGPGQLVGYPILPLGRINEQRRLPRADYIGYIRKLESVLIHSLAQLGLVTGQIEGKTGVWVQPDVASRCRRCPPEAKIAPSKIASIGVKVDARGISQHGFSLNVAPDMSYWEGIIACGLPGVQAISLADLFDDPPDMMSVVEEVTKWFGLEFEYEMRPHNH